MAHNERPDIVLVITDQQRADHCAREGFPLDTTLFMDALAQDGACFDRAYTTAPLCCPARTSLFTGRYPSAHRVVENSAAELAVPGENLFAVARRAGYATAMVGKNHTWLSASDVDYWDEFSHEGRVVPESEWTAFEQWLHDLRHRTAIQATPFPVEEQNQFRIVSRALAWANQQPADKPLLLVVSFPEPHNPYQVPEPWFSLFPPDSLPPLFPDANDRANQSFAWHYLHDIGVESDPNYDHHIARARANYCGMLRLIDDQVKRLHEGLAHRHQQRARLLVITADHGDYVGAFGLLRKGAEIPEMLARIPLIVSGDGIVQQRQHAFVSLADMMPTFCEAMAQPLPLSVQGRSLLPMLRGESWPEAEFASVYIEQGFGGLPYTADDIPMHSHPGIMWDDGENIPRLDELNAITQSGRHRKIRSGDWSLFASMTGEFRLFNIADDPFELHNRWNDPTLSDVRSTMLQWLAIWQMRAEDPLPIKAYCRKTDPHGYLAPYAEFPC